MAKRYLFEWEFPTILFRGTISREYVKVVPGARGISFTKKMKEATVFKNQDADKKIINFPSIRLQKIFLNDGQKFPCEKLV